MDLIGCYLLDLGIPDVRTKTHRQEPRAPRDTVICTCRGNRTLRNLGKELEQEEGAFTDTDHAPMASLFDDPWEMTA